MQRVKKSQKNIGSESAVFEKSYDSAGRVLSIKYLAGTPSEKIYGYGYDIAGNLVYVKDNTTGSHLVDYSDFTAYNQYKTANFPKQGNVSVMTSYIDDTYTARLKTVVTQKLIGGSTAAVYQILNYQDFDGT